MKSINRILAIRNVMLMSTNTHSYEILMTLSIQSPTYHEIHPTKNMVDTKRAPRLSDIITAQQN